MRSTRLAGAVLVLPLIAGLTACGAGSSTAAASNGSGSATVSASAGSAGATLPTAADLYKQARATATKATSLHVRGTTALGTDQAAQIDIAGQADGSNEKVTVTLPQTGTIILLVVGSSTYLQLTAELFQQLGAGAGDTSAYVGKWVSIPSAQAASMSGDISLRSLLDQIYSEPELTAAEAASTTVQRQTLDGTDVFVLSESGTGNSPSQVIVSADGKASLVRMVGPKAGNDTLDFSEWNAVAPFTAPAASDIVTVPGL